MQNLTKKKTRKMSKIATKSKKINLKQNVLNPKKWFFSISKQAHLFVP